MLLAFLVVLCAAACTPPDRRINPPRPEPDAVGVNHTVQLGEDIASIAELYGVAVSEISEVNRIKDPQSVSIGQRLFIPGALVCLEDRLELVKVPLEKPKEPVKRVPPREVKGEPFFVNPLAGTVIGRFGSPTEVGERQGMDIQSAGGASVVAAKTGTVYDTSTLGGWGNVIIIDHGSDEQTLYAHLDHVLVSAGEVVKQGQVIGKVGTSGRVSKPTLHFRIYRGGRPIDPHGRFSR